MKLDYLSKSILMNQASDMFLIIYSLFSKNYKSQILWAFKHLPDC